MSPDLILEPELLPPTPLPLVAPPKAMIGAAAAGAVLLAMAGLWSAGSSPFIAGYSRPVAPPSVALKAIAPPVVSAPVPAVLSDPAAGQPAVLTGPGAGQ